MNTTVRLSEPAVQVLDRLDKQVAATRNGFGSARQQILRVSLVLGALEPPTRADRRLRRVLDRSTITPLVLDPVAEHALRVLHPRWFGNVSACVEWALLNRSAETLVFLTQLTPMQQAEFNAAVLALPTH
jgi:hypothetical protein